MYLFISTAAVASSGTRETRRRATNKYRRHTLTRTRKLGQPIVVVVVDQTARERILIKL